MIYLSIVLSLVIGFAAGFYQRQIRDRLSVIEIKLKKDVQEEKEKKSELLDPDDEIQRMKWEMEERNKRLNG